MGHESKYTIEGIEAVEAQIRHLVEDAGYLQVWDRTDRSKEHQVGRFNFTATDAQPFLDEVPEVPDAGVDGDLQTWGEFEVYEDEPGESESPAVDCSGGVTSTQMAEAGIRWLRQLLEVNTVGEEWARFRTRIYSPKGAKTLHTATVVVRNHNSAHECPAPVTLIDPTMDVERATNAGVAEGMGALGTYYAQWGQIVLRSVGQLQGVNNDMMGRLHHQLSESRDQVDTLVAAVLENRYQQLQLQEEKKAEERSTGANHLLIREAISQIGDAAKTVIATKGLSPEMAEVVGVLGSSPELVGALQDPEVQELMKDPANLASLAQILKMTAAQAREAKAAPDPQVTV